MAEPEDSELAALMQDWQEGLVAKARRREEIASRQRQRVAYTTITVVVLAAEVDDVMCVLRRHPDVMFAGSESGVTPAALTAGADPGDWVPAAPDHTEDGEAHI